MEHAAHETEPTKISLNDFEVLIDVRPHAPTSPSISESIVVDLGDLITEPARWIPSHASSTLIICDIGLRSGLAAEHLRGTGYDFEIRHVLAAVAGDEKLRATMDEAVALTRMLERERDSLGLGQGG